MPAYVQRENGGLLVTFHRDGQDDEQRIADTGTQAVLIAMRLLAVRERLMPGDRLTVERR